MKNNLDRKLIETYEIKTKHKYASLFFSNWRDETFNTSLDNHIGSLKEVNEYFSNHFPESTWNLIDEKVSKNKTLYTFEAIPMPGSPADRNPGKYPKSLVKVRIRSKIHLKKQKRIK